MNKTGFIYEWFDEDTGLKYIGRHEGSVDDGYVGSGTKFIQEYEKRSKSFHRKILWKGIITESNDLKKIEESFLSVINNDELYYGSNPKYYNICKNANGYTSDDNPMKNPEIVQKMLDTRELKGTHKSPWERTVEKYGYEKACAMNRKIGNKNGTGNKGKPKSAEHKANIAKNRAGGKQKGWRKNKQIV